MTDNTTWGAPIRCKVKALADNDVARREKGQDTVIPYGTECEIGEPSGWFRTIKRRIIQWPYGVSSATTQIAFRRGDPASTAISRAISSFRW